MTFTDNASFKSYGVICWSLLPSSLPNDVSMDKRDSSNFFSTQRVCMSSDSSQSTINSLLTGANYVGVNCPKLCGTVLNFATVSRYPALLASNPDFTKLLAATPSQYVLKCITTYLLVSCPDPTSSSCEEKGLVNLDRFLGLASSEGARQHDCAKANL